MVAAAVVGSAAVGMVGASMASGAAKDAANTQAGAARDAAAMQQQQYQQVRSDLEPYRNLGTGSINALLQAMGYSSPNAGTMQTRDQIYQQMLPQYTNQGQSGGGYWAMQRGPDTSPNEGMSQPSYENVWVPNGSGTGSSSGNIDMEGLNAAVDAAFAAQQSSQYSNLAPDPNNILQQKFSFEPGDLTKTPGYQFNWDQGMRAVNNSAASRGLGLSGAQLKGATSFASGLADNTYQNQFGNALNTFNTNYNSASQNVNRLLGLVGNGQNAANQTGAFGMQTAGNVGNMMTSGANAQASGIVGSANAMANGLNGMGNNALMYSMMNGGGSGGGVNLYGIRQ